MKRSKRMIAAVLSILTVSSLFAGCGSKQTAESSAAPEGAASGTSNAAAATDWPKKTIQVICPFAPGGDSDFNARAYTEYLSKELGVSVVITSTAGNGGATGARKAKDSPNDGYNVLCTSSAFLTNELSGAIDFNIDQFEFSSICAQGPGNVVCVDKSLGINSLQELIDYTKKNPDKLTMAADTGATTQIIALMLKNKGVDAKIIDAGASADRIAALLGHHVDIIINSYGSVKDYISSGQFVALGLATDKQPEYIPDIPTCESQGIDVSFPSYFFFAFPKGTDQAIVDKFTAAVQKIATTNGDYAAAIKKAYSQQPVFYGGQEGLDKLNAARDSIAQYKQQFTIAQ